MTSDFFGPRGLQKARCGISLEADGRRVRQAPRAIPFIALKPFDRHDALIS